jgi:predicted phage terminase large subunit-like protein
MQDKQWCYVLTDPHAGTTRRVLESDCWTLITADTAMKEKIMNDPWVALVWHVERVMDEKGYQKGCTMFLRHVWRERCTAHEGERRLLELYDKWDPTYIGIEDKVSGTAVIQRFIRDGLRVRPIKADTDKVTRASTAQVWLETGKVWLPLDAPWLEPYQTEILTFPNGTHDDQVDATSHGVNFANNRDLWIQPAPEKFAPTTLGAIAGHDEV